jgi:hypothetical protein
MELPNRIAVNQDPARLVACFVRGIGAQACREREHAAMLSLVIVSPAYPTFGTVRGMSTR